MRKLTEKQQHIRELRMRVKNGDASVLRILYEKYGYIVITINGFRYNLQEMFAAGGNPERKPK